MKELKKWMLFGFLFVSVLGTLSHFVYDWSGRQAFLGLFFPINESVWEHTKLIFFPMLLFSAYAEKKLKAVYPCIGAAMLFGMLSGTLLIPILFYTYTGAIGFSSLFCDIAIFYIGVLFAFFIAYRAAVSCKAEPYGVFLKILTALLLLSLFVFTIAPPNLPLFISA